MTNFHFLKKINNNLYDIINDAEKLYRDEYFEQCITQTRRFGEQICKEMLKENNCQTGSFDEMLATLKDKSHGYPQEKEFIDDLYFLKKFGNSSVHSSKVKQDAFSALECLKRAFEIAVNYSVYNKDASTDILKLNYDIELLITNKKSKPSLQEKYEQAKQKEKTKDNFHKKTIVLKPQQKNSNIQSHNYKIPIFWKIIIFLSSISVLLVLILTIMVLIKK